MVPVLENVMERSTTKGLLSVVSKVFEKTCK